jgi:hypothetical protein
MAARKATTLRGQTSVNPPVWVAPALGGFKSVELTRAIRYAAAWLAQAAAEVAPMFSPDEWAVIAAALREPVIEPELPNPGPTLAAFVEMAHRNYGVGKTLEGGKGGEGVKSIAERLAALSAVQAAAVLVAVRFHCEHADELEEGEAWWEMAVRWEHLRPDEEE